MGTLVVLYGHYMSRYYKKYNKLFFYKHKFIFLNNGLRPNFSYVFIFKVQMMCKVFYILLGVFLISAPFFLYRKASINKMRLMDTFCFKWLSQKNKVFGVFFQWFKMLIFLFSLYFFLIPSIDFYKHSLSLSGNCFYIGFIFFILPCLAFLVNIFFYNFQYLLARLCFCR